LKYLPYAEPLEPRTSVDRVVLGRARDTVHIYGDTQVSTIASVSTYSLDRLLFAPLHDENWGTNCT